MHETALCLYHQPDQPKKDDQIIPLELKIDRILPFSPTILRKEGNYSITFAPFTERSDFGPLLAGLYRHHSEKIDLSYSKKLELQVEGWPIGADLIGESLVIKEMGLLRNCGFASSRFFVNILENIEYEAYKKGARRIYIELKNHKDHPIIDRQHEFLYKAFTNNQYVGVAGNNNMMTGDYEEYMMKELDKNVSKKESDSLVVSWTEEPDEFWPQISENSGFFVKKKGTVLGGAWGSFHENAKSPHLFIHALFMDESLRGVKFHGKTLAQQIIEEVEKYALKRNVSLIALGTGDVNPYKFYEKMGFERVYTIPKIHKGFNYSGDYGYLNAYVYAKKLEYAH